MSAMLFKHLHTSIHIHIYKCMYIVCVCVPLLMRISKPENDSYKRLNLPINGTVNFALAGYV